MNLKEPQLKVQNFLKALEKKQRHERLIVKLFALYIEEREPEQLQNLKDKALELYHLSEKVLEERVKLRDLFADETLNKLCMNCMYGASSLIVCAIEQMEQNESEMEGE